MCSNFLKILYIPTFHEAGNFNAGEGNKKDLLTKRFIENALTLSLPLLLRPARNLQRRRGDQEVKRQICKEISLKFSVPILFPSPSSQKPSMQEKPRG